MSIAETIEGYEENLRLVLREVEGLIEDLEGRIVITSDYEKASQSLEFMDILAE